MENNNTQNAINLCEILRAVETMHHRIPFEARALARETWQSYAKDWYPVFLPDLNDPMDEGIAPVRDWDLRDVPEGVIRKDIGEHYVVLSEGEHVAFGNLPNGEFYTNNEEWFLTRIRPHFSAAVSPPPAEVPPKGTNLKAWEEYLMRIALQEADGSTSLAAANLGCSQRKIQYRRKSWRKST